MMGGNWCSPEVDVFDEALSDRDKPSLPARSIQPAVEAELSL
jgi:hypothetical protein